MPSTVAATCKRDFRPFSLGSMYFDRLAFEEFRANVLRVKRPGIDPFSGAVSLITFPIFGHDAADLIGGELLCLFQLF